MAEASQRKLRQMLEMLIMLGSSKFGRSKQSLAEHFNVSLKTINRYINTFKDVGFVIDEKKGNLKINKLESDYKDLSELLYFSEDESEILNKAIDSITNSTELREQLKIKLYSIYNIDRIATPLVKKHHGRIIKMIREAIDQKKQVLLINYSSGNSQQIRNRLVEPFNFTHHLNAVWAYEPESDTNKTFKIDRIASAEIQTEAYMFEKEHKKNELDVFRMSSDNSFEVKLLLSIKAFHLLIEEFPRAEKFTKKLKNNSFEFCASVCDLKGVGRFVLGLCNEIKIIYPQELKDYVYEEMKRGMEKFSL